MVRLALLYLAMFSFKGPTFHTKGTCDSIPDPTWFLEVTFVIFCAKCPQNHFHPQIKNPKSKRKNPKQVSFLLATLSFCRCGNLFFGEKNPNETERRISCLEFVGRWCSQICQVDDCERDLQVLPEGNCWETSTSEWLIFWCRGSCPKGCLECCCPPLKKNFKENIRQKVQETENHVIHQFFILVLYLVNLCFNDESTLKLDRFSKKRTFHLHSYGSDDFSNGKLLFTFLLSDSKIAVERATTSSSRIFMIHDFFDRRRNEKRMTTNCWPFA